MSQIATRPASALETFRSKVHGQTGEITKALAGRISPDLFLRVLMTTVRNSPKLLECEPISLMTSVMEAAQVGLQIDGLLGHGYLVPYYDSKFRGYKAQFIPGYRGLISLMRRGGGVRSIRAACIHEHDEYEVRLGTDGYIRHVPNLFQERGEILAAYAVAEFSDGGRDFRIVTRDRLLEHQKAARDKQKGKEYGPWFEHFEAMAEKTAVRALAKWVPINDEGTTAASRYASMDERVDAGLEPGETPYTDVEVVDREDDPEERAAAIAEALEATPEPEQE